MSKLYVILPVVSLLFILSSCSAVKKCAEPELDLPKIMVTDFSNDSLCMADIEWSEFYSDSLLKSLIVKTLENNKDMLTASSKVEELQKRYRIAKTNLLPSISAEGLVDNETNDYEGESFTSSPEFSAKATLSWEIDLFGRLRWANKAAKFDYLSSLEAKRAMQMVLISEVATAYFELIALDNELTIVRNTVSTRTENVRQAKLRFEGGLTSETSYQQSKVELASAASMIPKLEKEVKQKENELSFLAGEYPSHIERSKLMGLTSMDNDSLQLGIPSDLLLRRPDLQQAELELKTSMAEVGIAWADRFPRFVINLTGGLENDALQGLLSSPFSYIAGEIASPVFAFGRRKAQYEAAIERYNQNRYQYEKAVLNAFKEVNDAVIAYTSAKETVHLMQILKESAQKYIELAYFQYINGYINYIDVLDAQRKYFDAQIDLSNAEKDEHLALIQLYKALGGGWSVE